MNYYRHMDRGSVQFDFLVHKIPDPSVVDEIEAMGGRVEIITPKSTSIVRNVFETFHHINARTVHSAVHVHTAGSTSIAYLLAAQLARKRLRIVHSHATNLEDTRNSLHHLLHRMLRPLLRLTGTHLFACSEEAGDWLFGKQRRTIIMPNAIDVRQFAFSPEVRASTRDLLDLTDRIVVGHVGRFVFAKNHEFLVNMFSHLAQSEPSALLLLIGEGALSPDVKQQVTSLGLDDRVRFLGARGDVSTILQAMDVLVLPSRFEGLPVILVEAQASGLPCVASDHISAEVCLTDLVEFADLDDGPEDWARIALRAVVSSDRTDRSRELRDSGYDIPFAASRLATFYLESARCRFV